MDFSTALTIVALSFVRVSEHTDDKKKFKTVDEYPGNPGCYLCTRKHVLNNAKDKAAFGKGRLCSIEIVKEDRRLGVITESTVNEDNKFVIKVVLIDPIPENDTDYTSVTFTLKNDFAKWTGISPEFMTGEGTGVEVNGVYHVPEKVQDQMTYMPQLPVPEPVAEPVIEPVAEPVLEPVAEPVIEPVAEPVIEPVAEPVDEPVIEPVLEPVAEPVQITDAERLTILEEKYVKLLGELVQVKGELAQVKQKVRNNENDISDIENTTKASVFAAGCIAFGASIYSQTFASLPIIA